ncbi:hypothetical protein [Calothrix sp. UHCC 0171]|uniref:hypothetical protein n=1 Tax=Calothrix sp. UHCC 0171 TaxID=3110245 RepID=UPI002B20D9E8|nr:hypothetical protein [Calothrix sp. UHCC 0171]MEA5573013.1 hypothetical protein [Calothrix sp. UHCC 0171]
MASSLIMLPNIFIVTDKVYAGGYDTPEERNLKLLNNSPFLSWKTWEKPYMSGNNLCRNKHGNVICLSIKNAKKVGAHVYSPQKPSTSLKPQYQYSDRSLNHP